MCGEDSLSMLKKDKNECRESLTVTLTWIPYFSPHASFTRDRILTVGLPGDI